MTTQPDPAAPVDVADRRTISVGDVHTLDPAGACLETCPHPVHDGPVLVAMDTRLKAMLDDWISDLGLTSEYVPSDDELRTYMVVIPPEHPLNRATAFNGIKMRAPERGSRKRS